MLPSISPSFSLFSSSSQKTRCVQSATLTIPRRRFRDKAERARQSWKTANAPRVVGIATPPTLASTTCEQLPKLFHSGNSALLYSVGKRARHEIDEIDGTAPVYREMTNGFCGIASLVPPLSIWCPRATPKQSPLANRLSTFIYRYVDDIQPRQRHIDCYRAVYALQLTIGIENLKLIVQWLVLFLLIKNIL